MYRILVINPGSTSTKLAVYEDRNLVVQETLRHSSEELAPYPKIIDQYEFRENLIIDFLEHHDVHINSLDAVVGRGGLIYPVEGGCYRINNQMIQDLKDAVMGEHASNLGALIAKAIATAAGWKPSFIVNPVVVDELAPLARYSGSPLIPRVSIFHALNQKEVARNVAKELGKPYNDCNFVIAHLGGGITVGAHRQGRVIDVNNGIDGDGPFSPERTGGLPGGEVAHICFSGKYTLNEVKKLITGKGGLVAYLGTNDAAEVTQRIENGDQKAREAFEAMAYQVAKAIGEMAAVLEGALDAIILTGGLAHNTMFIDWITERVHFIAPIKVVPGEDEMFALLDGTLRVLTGDMDAKEYRGAPEQFDKDVILDSFDEMRDQPSDWGV